MLTLCADPKILDTQVYYGNNAHCSLRIESDLEKNSATLF